MISSPSTMDTSAEDEITKHFPSVVDATLLTRLNQLCRTHKLTAEQLSTQWEMVCINDGGGGEIKMSMDTIAQLERRCANSSAKATAGGSRIASKMQARQHRPMSTFTRDNIDLLNGGRLSVVTPQRGPRPGGPITPLSTGSPSAGSPASGAFANRQDSGKVVHTVNALLGPATSFPQLAVEPRLPAEAPSHFMWERMDERARLLDQGVMELEAALLLEPGLPPLRGVTGSGEEATVAGRVCGEVDGKLNAKSIFIEGSRGLSNGFRVRLDLSQCTEYAVFPGQLIAAVGTNPAGHTFVATRLLTVPRPAPVERGVQRRVKEAFNVMTAAGPFCCADDLAYAPLVALLKEAKTRKAALLVLHGPFVDEQHPTAGTAALSVTFDELFEQHVLRLLEVFVQEQLDAGGPVTQVVVLPALRDVHHVPVFPQPKFGAAIHSKDVRKHLHLLPNPASFEAGGYTFACSSLDTMMLLTQQELSRMAPVQPGQPRPERLGRLASHMVRQRQFLPLFPASADGSIPVDVSACLQRGALSARPHVLLVPSDLGPFAKAADGGILALNSGRAARGAGGGTYGFLTLHPPFAADEPPPAAGGSGGGGGGGGGDESERASASVVEAEAMEVEEATATEAAAPATDGAAAGGAEAAQAVTVQADAMEGVSESDGIAATARSGAAEGAVKPEPLPLAAAGAAGASSSSTGAATEAKPDAAAAALVPVAVGGEAAAQAAQETVAEAAAVAAQEAAREAEEQQATAAHDVFPRTFVEIIRL
jgi:DNA polymerase alpha subunit B